MSVAFSPPRVADAALAFQGELDRLIVDPPPRLLRAWPGLGAALLAGLVGLAAVMPLDIVVTASGELAADAPPVVLKPMTRAVLRDLLVRPGDRVRAGQVLARLDPTLPEADRAALMAERDSVAAQIARLRAELSGQPLASGSAAHTAFTHYLTELRALELPESAARPQTRPRNRGADRAIGPAVGRSRSGRPSCPSGRSRPCLAGRPRRDRRLRSCLAS